MTNPVASFVKWLSAKRRPREEAKPNVLRLELSIYVKQDGSGEISFTGDAKELLAAVEKAGDIIVTEMSKQEGVQIKKTTSARIVVEPEQGVLSKISIFRRGRRL